MELKTDYEKQLYWTAHGLEYAASSIMRSFGNEDNAEMLSSFIRAKAKECEDLLKRVQDNPSDFERDGGSSGV